MFVGPFLIGCWFVTLFCAGQSARLSLDAIGIQDVENQKILFSYNLLSHLDHLATNTFKLRLNPKAKQSLGFLQNVTETGVSFEGLTDIPDAAETSKRAFKNLSSSLSKQSLALLEALSNKGLEIPIVLQPKDEHLNATIKFMDAFKSYWKSIDDVSSMQVEDLDLQNSPIDVLEAISVRTVNEVVREDRSLAKPFQVSKLHLELLLKDIFILPRSHDTSKLEKVVIQTFISRKFEDYGLIVTEHDFSAHETEYLYGHQIIGTNVIGILPGKFFNSSQDRPIIIGAHYDTVPGTSGSIDNGSGSAGLLEVARLLSSSECQFNHSIFFVAFDLEEIGTQGSFMFVKDILLKLFFPNFGIKTITGAIILDCIANWDPSSNSQMIPKAWEDKVEGLTERVAKNNNLGDFMAIMYREKPDGVVAERVQHYYKKLNENQFSLEMMPLKNLHLSRPNDSVNLENFDFFRSDHYRFWYPSSVMPNISFPAVLLTDTGPYRGRMKECYHSKCDNYEEMKPNIDFLSKIVSAAVWATADLAELLCEEELEVLFQRTIQEDQELNPELNEIENTKETEEDRPLVTVNGVMEILRYLGRLDPGTLETSFDVIKANISQITKARVTSSFEPIKNKRNPNDSSSASKLTITIHGKNSKFYIPLQIAHQSETTRAPKPKPNIRHKVSFESHVKTKTKIYPRFRNPLETNIGTSLQVSN